MTASDAPSHLFVLMGGTGDLARRKLLPAVYRLSEAGRLAGRWAILAVARDDDMDDQRFRELTRESLKEAGVDDMGLLSWCESCLHYQCVGESVENPYQVLRDRIEAIESGHKLPGNRLFYLALPPRAFAPTLDGMGSVGLQKSEGWTRVVLEKPIGRDLDSAIDLEEKVHEWFEEEQIYRIDHYLGKETVQNLLVFRFGNTIFESLWNRERVENVQITVAEDIGVEGRAGYYDKAGALRDMVQNHLTQLLSLVAMEVPAHYDATSVRNEKIKVLHSVKPIEMRNLVRGQYAADGDMPGYRDDDAVGEDSRTETFVALRVDVDNWRWQGVPFYLRTGKRLPRRVTEIAVTFRRPPVRLFERLDCEDVTNEALILRIQPDEGFELFLDVKRPGEPLRIERIPLKFAYENHFGKIHDAYVTLLLDALQGDQTLFVHTEEVQASWKLYTPLLADKAETLVEIYDYAAGSWGPGEADVLLERWGHQWLTK